LGKSSSRNAAIVRLTGPLPARAGADIVFPACE
jgi:hypothetical protein